MRNVAVCIPTLRKSHLLNDLCRDVLTDQSVQYLEIMDNSAMYPLYSNQANKLHREILSLIPNYVPYNFPWVNIMGTKGQTIYEMWNGFRTRQEYYRDYLVFLNDDIVIKEGTVTAMRDALERDLTLAAVYPDYTASWDSGPTGEISYTDSTAGDGGMSGYCYMIRAGIGIPQIDENLKLYWGDDDLVKQIGKMGLKIGRVVGLPIQHAGSLSIKTRNPDEVRSLMEADRAYFNQKYGERREPVSV